MTGQMDDRTVVITGAARGQGAQHARLLVAEGATVVLCDVLDELGTAVADELGPSATYVHLDVASEHDWNRLADLLAAGPGAPSGLVNNAGIMSRQPIASFDVDEFRRVLDVNVLGTALGMRTVVPLMPVGGSIVNISSIAAERVLLDLGAYSASKWAIKGLTRLAAREYGGRGVRVNAVIPGVITTDMVVREGNSESDAMTQHADMLSIKRLGAVTDIAEAVLYLLSDRSSYVTGTDLVVDGGWVLH